MPKGTGQRGHRTKGDSALSRKATQHHDFVGQAEPERDKSRAVEQQRIRRDQEELEKETVKEMAMLDALRAKAEERLVDMPAPVRAAVHLTERAIGLALWPVRTGARLFGRALETPAALVRILMARRTT